MTTDQRDGLDPERLREEAQSARNLASSMKTEHLILVYGRACWEVGKTVGESNAKLPESRPKPEYMIPTYYGHFFIEKPEDARQGYRDGYEAGHEAGWNACIEAMRKLYADMPRGNPEAYDRAENTLDKLREILIPDKI